MVGSFSLAYSALIFPFFFFLWFLVGAPEPSLCLALLSRPRVSDSPAPAGPVFLSEAVFQPQGNLGVESRERAREQERPARPSVSGGSLDGRSRALSLEACLEGGHSHAEVCSFNKYLLTLLCAASRYNSEQNRYSGPRGVSGPAHRRTCTGTHLRGTPRHPDTNSLPASSRRTT